MSLPDIDPEILTMNKVVRTFRMPQDLIHALGKEAHQRNLDLTALVLRVLHGYLTYFALPEAASASLEADRETLKMDRHQYLAHLLYHRCLAIREQGLGFDDPHGPPIGSGVLESPERIEPPALPLGAAGGGAHGAVTGSIPGTGIWPYGPKKKPPL